MTLVDHRPHGHRQHSDRQHSDRQHSDRQLVEWFADCPRPVPSHRRADALPGPSAHAVEADCCRYVDPADDRPNALSRDRDRDLLRSAPAASGQ